MEALTMKIELKNYRPPNSTSFSGRPQGVEARTKIKISELDQKEIEEVEFIIPGDTTSFNPSFFLGLLYDSIKKLGFERFNKKYHLIIETDNPDRKRALEKNIEDGFRSAYNTLNGKDIFSFFS